MARPKLTVPRYRRHQDARRDRAFIELGGRRVNLGEWNTPPCKDATPASSRSGKAATVTAPSRACLPTLLADPRGDRAPRRGGGTARYSRSSSAR
jgi:hypothetical protein